VASFPVTDTGTLADTGVDGPFNGAVGLAGPLAKSGLGVRNLGVRVGRSLKLGTSRSRNDDESITFLYPAILNTMGLPDSDCPTASSATRARAPRAASSQLEAACGRKTLQEFTFDSAPPRFAIEARRGTGLESGLSKEVCHEWTW
jgi:hypothetical protein